MKNKNSSFIPPEYWDSPPTLIARKPNNRVSRAALSSADLVRVQRMVLRLAKSWERRADVLLKNSKGEQEVWISNALAVGCEVWRDAAKELRAEIAKSQNGEHSNTPTPRP